MNNERSRWAFLILAGTQPHVKWKILFLAFGIPIPAALKNFTSFVQGGDRNGSSLATLSIGFQPPVELDLMLLGLLDVWRELCNGVALIDSVPLLSVRLLIVPYMNIVLLA